MLRNPQCLVARLLLPGFVHPEKAGLAEVGGVELRGHIRDADVVGVAGNPGVGPRGRSLQAGGPGSCGVTYKLSVVFV